MDMSNIRLVRSFYVDEITDHAAYETLASKEQNKRLRDILAKAAGIEMRHAAFWRAYLEKHGAEVPLLRPKRLRLLLLRSLQRLVNPVLLVAALELGESRALKAYHACLASLDLDDKEKAALKQIIVDEIEHELTFRGESTKLGLGSVRDFVLGMNDGLVEVLGVVTGLSALYAASPAVVATSGLIVGVAGALSMGIGAFISVRSERQVSAGRRERAEVLFDVAPERAVGEYRDKLIGSGLPEEIAASVATHLGENKEALARLLLHEDRTNELRSGLLTALAYLGGAFPPLVPYFFASNSLYALAVSVPVAALALAVVAGVISLFSGISVGKKALEMIVASSAAAALSFAFGKVLQGLGGAGL